MQALVLTAHRPRRLEPGERVGFMRQDDQQRTLQILRQQLADPRRRRQRQSRGIAQPLAQNAIRRRGAQPDCEVVPDAGHRGSRVCLSAARSRAIPRARDVRLHRGRPPCASRRVRRDARDRVSSGRSTGAAPVLVLRVVGGTTAVSERDTTNLRRPGLDALRSHPDRRCPFPMTQPFFWSAHQPSSTLTFRAPFMAAFMPLVPLCSIGRRGVLSHTSTP